MKTHMTLFAIVSVLLVFTSCGKTESKDSTGNIGDTITENQILESATDSKYQNEDKVESNISLVEHDSNDSESQTDNDVDIVPEFESESQLRQYLILSKDTQNPRLFEKDDLINYSFDNIPVGYKLAKAMENGIFLTYRYLNEKDNSQISFMWGFGTEGKEYLKNAIKTFGLTALPGYEGYYYSKAIDDTGTDIYQIYWSEDGYCFQLNIPSDMIISHENGAIKTDGMDFTISRNTYKCK